MATAISTADCIVVMTWYLPLAILPAGISTIDWMLIMTWYLPLVILPAGISTFDWMLIMTWYLPPVSRDQHSWLHANHDLIFATSHHACQSPSQLIAQLLVTIVLSHSDPLCPTFRYYVGQSSQCFYICYFTISVKSKNVIMVFQMTLLIHTCVSPPYAHIKVNHGGSLGHPLNSDRDLFEQTWDSNNNSVWLHSDIKW